MFPPGSRYDHYRERAVRTYARRDDVSAPALPDRAGRPAARPGLPAPGAALYGCRA
jgi:hypothetical protein